MREILGLRISFDMQISIANMESSLNISIFGWPQKSLVEACSSSTYPSLYEDATFQILEVFVDECKWRKDLSLTERSFVTVIKHHLDCHDRARVFWVLDIGLRSRVFYNSDRRLYDILKHLATGRKPVKVQSEIAFIDDIIWDHEFGDRVVNDKLEIYSHVQCDDLLEVNRYYWYSDCSITLFPLTLEEMEDPGLRLLLSGDVETNPGPVMSKIETQQNKQINDLKRQVSKLRKEIEKKEGFVQRQLELEKRARAKNRKDLRGVKYAQNEMENVKRAISEITASLRPSQDNMVVGGVAALTALNPTLGTSVGSVIAANRVARITTKTEGILDSINSFLELLKSKANDLCNMFSIPKEINLIGMFASLHAIYMCYTSNNYVMLGIHLVNFAQALGMSYDVVASFFVHPAEEEPQITGSTPVAQNMLNDILCAVRNSTELSSLTTFITFLISIFVYHLTAEKNPLQTLKIMGDVARAASAVTCGAMLIKWITNYMSEIYYQYVHGVTREQYQLMEQYSRLSTLYAAVQIIKDIKEEDINSSMDLAEEICLAHKELTDFHLTSLRIGARSVASVCERLLKQVSKKFAAAFSSPARNVTVRKEPLAIYLYGLPGVGKSVLTQVLKTKLFKDFYSQGKFRLSNCCYSRKVSTEFWDGYIGQPIVELDEFSNTKDSMTTPNTLYQEFQYMVNTCAYPLHMAALENKGNTMFTSEVILATANDKIPDIYHMTDPGSIYRRFKIYAEVKVMPAYGKVRGKDDQGNDYYVRDPQKCGNEPLSTNHYEIQVYRVDYNYEKKLATRVNLDTYSFDSFYDYVKNMMNSHNDEQKNLTRAIRQLVQIEEKEPDDTVNETVRQLRGVFNPDRFIQSLTDCTEIFVSASDKNVSDESTANANQAPNSGGNQSSQSAPEAGVIDAEIFDIDYAQESWLTCQGWKRKFKQAYERGVESFKRLWRSMRGLTNSLLGVAEFILSLLSSGANTLYTFLNDNVSAVSAISGIIITGLLGWLTVYFRRVYFGSGNTTCSFVLSPSHGTAPCGTCVVCKIINFSSRGNTLEEYSLKLATPQVQKELENIGFDLSKVVEVQKMILSSYAQAVYDKQPLVPKVKNVAQRVYDPAPLKPKLNNVAQNGGNMLLATDAEIGSIKFCQGDIIRLEQTTQVLVRNSVWLSVVNEDNIASRSNGVFLVGRTLLTTAHTVLNDILGKPAVRIMIQNPYSNSPSIVIPIKDCKISQMEYIDGKKVDLVLISFPPVVPSRPKIISKFIRAEDVELLEEGDLVFSGFYEKEGKTVIQEKYPNFFQVNRRKSDTYYMHKPGTCPKNAVRCPCAIEINNFIEYELDTLSGMCGALLSITNKAINTKLVGIHVAGGSNALALGAIVSHQFLEYNLAKHVDKFKIPNSYLIDGRYPQSMVDTSALVGLVNDGDCLSVGLATKPRFATTTQLSPSLIYGLFGPSTMKPAHLKTVTIDGVQIDPMKKGIIKIMNSQQYLEPVLLDMAANDVFSNIVKTGKTVLSYEEAIVGIDGDKYIGSLNRTTSPGYPYNLNNAMKGKTYWFGNDDEFDLSNLEIRRDVDKLVDDARRGIRGEAISMATLKDEKRPIAKVDAGKTRVFEACPQHLVIAIRQYFLPFAADVMRGRIDNGIAVGINPYSLEWTKLAARLLSQGNNMVAGDFTNFDGSLLMQVLHKILENINDWCDDGEDNKMIRYVLWEHIMNADVIVGEEVIRQTHSQPSGNPLTVIINSLFNLIIMRYVYLCLKRKNGKPLICDYRKYVADIAYGDDDIKSISEEIIDWFNQLTITDELAKIGLTYTDETKGGAVVPSKPLDETYFLKRKFVLNDDCLYDSPMDISNIIEMCYWVRGKMLRKATKMNCEQALMEFAVHPKEIYDEWRVQLRNACLANRFILETPTWYEQRNILSQLEFY